MTVAAAPAPSAPSALDPAQSPFTGWTRAHWVALLARLTYGFTLAAARSGSPARALYPDDRRGLPDSVDGIESFARIASGWAAWLSQPANPEVIEWDGHPLDLAALLRQGLLEGTDPHDPRTYWGDIEHMDQRLVESADLALAVWLTRERVFNRFTPGEQAQVLRWLAQVDGRGVYIDNWYMFPALAQTVRLCLGQPVPLAELDSSLDRMAEFYRGDGWYVDGIANEFELYNAWMFNGHYLQWAALDGVRRPEYRDRLLARSRSFLAGFLRLFGANGVCPAWGRSLVYRFALAGCFQVAHQLGIAPAAPGVLRRLSSGSLRYFSERGLFDPVDHHLTNGYHGHYPPAGEPYISPGSVYWCCRGLYALAFAPDDPFWTEPEAPLPVEQDDYEVVLPGPGFVVSGRRATGQVLLLNSRAGQEHEAPGYHYAAKYGKLAYSTHFPFNVAAVRGSQAPDGMVSLTRDGRAFGHRLNTLTGGVAPGFSWACFPQMVEDEIQLVWAAVLLWGDRQVRLARLQPTFPVRAFEAPAALGCAQATTVTRRSDPASGWEYAEAEGRAVGIRRLLGYDGQQASAPFLGQSNLNLAYPYAEQPLVCETEPSALVRCVAAISLARPAPFDPAAEFAQVAVAASPNGAFRISLPDGDEAFAAVGAAPPEQVSVGGVSFTGAAIRQVRVAAGGQCLSGSGAEQIEGVAAFSAPAIFQLVRGPAGSLTALTNAGIEFDSAWIGGPLRRARVEALDGSLVDVTVECGAAAVPAAVIRSWRARNERELITLRLDV